MNKALLTIIGITALAAHYSHAQEINPFNGRDLTGWDGLKEFWSVKDGAITGKTTKANQAKQNTFLVWRGGEVSDFEFTCKFKMTAGDASGFCNSGIQYRSKLVDPAYFVMSGYQADMGLGPEHYTGMLYEEKGAAFLQRSVRRSFFRKATRIQFRLLALSARMESCWQVLTTLDGTNAKSLLWATTSSISSMGGKLWMWWTKRVPVRRRDFLASRYTRAHPSR